MVIADVVLDRFKMAGDMLAIAPPLAVKALLLMIVLFWRVNIPEFNQQFEI
jgi:hypothetical protein